MGGELFGGKDVDQKRDRMIKYTEPRIPLLRSVRFEWVNA